jgi:protein subunit release factor A
MAAEVDAETRALSERLDKLEFELSFSGPYDRRGAIVAIHAGAGGTESQDWTEMLLRMYLRWAERRAYQTDLIDVMPGDEAGIKSATLEIDGRLAYGRLRSERGVHRLVRLSPFDADHARHTSFALVEVMPQAEGGAVDQPRAAHRRLPGGGHAARMSKERLPFASPTCPPASSRPARTSARNTETVSRRCACWRRGCSSES